MKIKIKIKTIHFGNYNGIAEKVNLCNYMFVYVACHNVGVLGILIFCLVEKYHFINATGDKIFLLIFTFAKTWIRSLERRNFNHFSDILSNAKIKAEKLW